MAVAALEIVGLCLGVIGLIGTTAVTGMPQWRVTAFIESNIVVFETIWEGLWMNCIRHANIRMQCKVYDSLLALTPDLQAARGLMCVAVILTLLAVLIAIIGMKCTRCTGDNERVKGYIVLTAGIIFILAGVIVLIPVSWTGHNIIRDFYNPLVDLAQKRELGEALYIGWATAGVLIAGGAILCCTCCCAKEEKKQYSYSPQQATYSSHHVARRTASTYSKSQYV
ncbi:claudin-8-like [Protopterus annectens]|uniref:claudin-8-like n=1 Tax=Protopterus annectens TaxID=7888 RepID=UPI001CFBA74C|nr:claudin-8-like [Protopterus annectens]